MFGFDIALWHIKNGKYVTRKGWNTKGQYVALHTPDFDDCKCSGCVSYMGTSEPFCVIASGTKVNAWAPSQSDLLAEDWVLYGKGQ